eukprot:126749-Ditylum_brightwellii.AAC.1
MSHQFKKYNIVEKAAQLKEDTKDVLSKEAKERLVNLDKNINAAMIKPEQKIYWKMQPWWLEELHQAHLL